ncbi:hypothetical protein CK203_100115 [Vitis vinifera]|uniref:Uncharacterized protein n=1 Tax=Vitis vinifera TaxID=29760 RepID=A0A438C7S7_VITVI|nr:hypothetical protein CK203_100115 [Vitis vinifera]
MLPISARNSLMQGSIFLCPLLSNSSSISLRSLQPFFIQCCPSAYGMKRPGHALPIGPLSTEVTRLPNSNKGREKGHVLVSSPWSGPYEGPNREFYPRHSLEIPSKNKSGWLVEWVEKASFSQLNKLFEIFASKRDHQVLFMDKNLQVHLEQRKKKLQDRTLMQALATNCSPLAPPSDHLSRRRRVLLFNSFRGTEPGIGIDLLATSTELKI